MRVSLLFVVLAVAAVGCSRSLELPPPPQPPQRGSVKGVLDTSAARPRVAPSGHTVRLIAASGSALTQTTGANGEFVFADLLPGVYLFDVKVAGFGLEFEPGVTVLGGQETDLGTRTLQWLAGTVAEAFVAGRVTTADDAQPTGAQLSFLLQPGDTEVAITSIGDEGVFAQRVPPGTYRLRASHHLYVTTLTDPLEFGEGASIALQDPIVLALNPATVSGAVQLEVDVGDGGINRVPGSGVSVTIDPGGMTTTTQQDGTFSLAGLSGGRKTIRFSRVGYEDPIPLHEVTLEPGQLGTLPPVTLFLQRGEFVGTIALADRQPAVNVSVSVTGTTYSTVAVPDPVDPSRASFRLSRLPVATGYEVVAVKQGYGRGVRGGQAVTANNSTDVGTLTLTALQGDFVVDDGDNSNTAGFTRAVGVTLQLQPFASMGAAEYRASEDPSFPDAGFAPFTAANQAFTLDPAQGTHTVYAQYRDGSGTSSQVFVSKIVLDSVPPSLATVELNAGAAFTNNGSAVDVRLTAVEEATGTVDAVSGLREMRIAEAATVDGAGRLASTPRPYQRDFAQARGATADGPFTLFAQLFDHAGNQTMVVNDVIVVDTALPTGAFVVRRGPGATDDGFTRQERITIDGTAAAEPNSATLRVRLANSVTALTSSSFFPFTSPAVLLWDLDPAGADGLRNVSYQFQDSAGNVSAPLQATITLDRTAPVSAPLTVVGGALLRSAALVVNVAATDALAGLSASQGLTLSEDATFTAPGTIGPVLLPAGGLQPFTLGGGDGSKLLYARYRDRAGNDALASVRLELDSTPPAATFALEGVLGDGSTSGTTTAIANVTAIVTQLGATGQLIGNELLTVCPASGYAPIPANGRIPVTLSGSATPREVHLCLIDAAGNTLGPLVRTLALDAVPPSGCQFTLSGTRADGSPAAAGQTARSTVTVSTTNCSELPTEWVVTEGTLTCSAPNLPWVAYAPGGSFALLGGDGSHTVVGCVRDASRNFFAPTAAVISLDSTPPAGAGLSLDTGAPFVNGAQYLARASTFRVSAAGAVTGATEWSISTTTTFTTFQPYPATSPQNFTFGAGGSQRLYAVFRDAVGNLSDVVLDDITFDITAPVVTGVTLGLVTNAPDPTFIASDSVGLRFTPAPPGDAATTLLLQVPTTTACSTAGLFTGAVPRPVTSDLAIVVNGGDGAKRLCAAFVDAAGNLSAALSLDFTVDTLAPDAPEVVTADTTNNLADNATFNVALARAVVETNFLRYEKNGGKLAGWTLASATQATTTFPFNVVSTAAQAQVVNVLQLRAIDRAGNIGPLSRVLVTTDLQAPNPPTLDRAGVSNFTQSAAVYWAPTTSTDVTTYLLDYGPAPGQYDGVQASEGQSPIALSTTLTSMTLHGLTDGSPTYVRMRAIDRAGNVSLGSTEVTLQPNVVSPTFIAETVVAGSAGGIGRLVVQEDIAYALGPNVAGCFPSATALGFTALDLGQLKAATQAGSLQLPVPTVGTLWSTSIAAPLTFTQCTDNAYDLLVDGPWAFVAVDSSVLIYRLTSRVTPVLYSTITLPFTVRALALKGTTLFANGDQIAAIGLDTLFDENATTRPTAADIIGTAINGLSGSTGPTSAVISRNRMFQTSTNTVATPYYDIVSAADGNPGTPWGSANQVALIANPVIGRTTYAPEVSGNLLYAYSAGVLQLRDLRPTWTGAVNNPLSLSSLVLAATLATSSGMIAMAGRDLTLADRDGTTLFSVDGTSGAGGNFALSSRYTLDTLHRARAMASYGPYLVMGTSSGRVQFYEQATPRGLRPTVTRNKGHLYEVSGGFAYGANGSVLDLQSGALPSELVPDAELANPNFSCASDLVRFEEQVVSAPSEGKLNVIDVSKAVDRDAVTTLTLTPLSDGYSVTFPLVQQFLALETYGQVIVALERRADGYYLEVFTAKALRDTSPGTLLSPSDSLGSFRFSAAMLTAATTGRLAISNGRAFVTVRDEITSAGFSPSLFALDFRALLDDDATTSGISSRGSLPITGAGGVVVSGALAFVAVNPLVGGGPNDALEVWSIAPALDDVGSPLSATAPVGRLLLSHPISVKTYGGYAFVANDRVGVDARTWAIDVGNPAAPRVASLALASVPGSGCSGPTFGTTLHGSVQVIGRRLLLGNANTTTLLELE